ncbi:hypothetical protein DL98DRAFT_582932 [Cadophora sp. DSE1049]|nr:hypothetical protein DL98DRAFT_582932 [Cadophora sp. DSE1049]
MSKGVEMDFIVPITTLPSKKASAVSPGTPLPLRGALRPPGLVHVMLLKDCQLGAEKGTSEIAKQSFSRLRILASVSSLPSGPQLHIGRPLSYHFNGLAGMTLSPATALYVPQPISDDLFTIPTDNAEPPWSIPDSSQQAPSRTETGQNNCQISFAAQASTICTLHPTYTLKPP